MTGAELAVWLAKELLPEALKEPLLQLMKRRAERARAIFLDEISRHEATVGDIDDHDEVAAIVFEYLDATRRGAARQNLRLLAQVAAHELTTPPIHADDFLRWSRLLSDLSYEELVTLAEFHTVSMGASPPTPIERLELELVGKSKLFETAEEMELTLHSLTRTGLVVPSGTYGGIGIRVTSRLTRLMKIARMEDVLTEPRT